MQLTNLVNDLPPIKSTLSICKGCVFGKQSKLPYSTEPVADATKVLPLIHTDLCGPMSTPLLSFIITYSLLTTSPVILTSIFFKRKMKLSLSSNLIKLWL
jgi:hypothetical protein